MSTINEGPEGDVVPESQASGFARQTFIMFKRWSLKTARNPMVTFMSLVQPVIFFVLVVEVFGAIAGDIVQTNYVAFLTPAVIIQSALAAASVSGIGLVHDIDTGMFDKVLASPIHRGAMFLGKALSVVVRIVVQTILILALAFGLLVLDGDASVSSFVQTGIAGVVGILVITVLFAGIFMAFSNIVALKSRDQEATIMIANLLTFPLLFISPAFLPLSTLPGWIQTVAVINPITYGVDGIRALMLDADVMTVIGVSWFSGPMNTVVPAVLVCLAFNIVLGGVAIRLLNHASRADVQ